jgi:3-hydroxyisobutyrate dehydrogenase-like beta-hydroxyacid dehydrogenase
VVNQIIVAITIEVASKSFLFAAKAGADPVKAREALILKFVQRDDYSG